MTKAQLDKNKLLELLEKADAKWFNSHSGQFFKYREHLDFVAEYVSTNYHKKGENYGNTGRRSSRKAFYATR